MQLVIYVREKPTIRSIDYKGLNSVTLSDVQERFKKAKVGLTVESQFDETRVKRAEDVLKDLLSEHGHQFATIRTGDQDDSSVVGGDHVPIKEGPTVKVGKIAFDGNYNLSSRDAARRDGEHAADRDSALDHSGEPVCADVRRQQAGRGHGAGAPGVPATAATSRRRPAKRRPMCATRAA